MTDPFGTVPDGFFYATAPLKQRIDLILHLIEFGRQIIVVTGRPDSGKTTLLNEINTRAAAVWQSCLLRATPLLAQASVIERLSQVAAPDSTAGSVADRLEILKSRLQLMAASQAPLAVLIDDAQHLPVDPLKLLLALAEAQNPPGGLRLVLALEQGATPPGSLLPSGAGATALVHTVELPPFTLEDTAGYLSARLRATGTDPSFALEPRTLARIHRESQGLPGKIAVCARQYLHSVPPPHISSPVPPPRYRLRRVLPILVAAGAIGIGLIWFFNRAQPPSTPAARVELLLPEPAPVQSGESEARSRVEPHSPDEQVPVGESDPPLEPLSPGLLVEPAGTLESAPLAETPATDQAPAESPSVEQATEQGREPADVTVAPVVPREAPPRDLAWLLGQRDGYTIQLFGSHKLAEAKQVLSRPDLKDLIGAESRYQGRPWYIVFYGHYRTRAEALAALAALPSDTKAFDPWARPIQSAREASPRALQ